MGNRKGDGGMQAPGAVQLRGPAVLETVDGQIAVVEHYGGPIKFASDRNAWERQPSETARQWYHFKLYRDLDPEARTQAACWRAHVAKLTPEQQKRASAQAPPWISHMVHDFRWRERVRAFDHHTDTIAQEAMLRQRVRSRVETAELGRTLRLKAAEAARVLQTTTTQIIIVDGVQKRVVRSALTPTSIAHLAKVGTELERMALGLEAPGQGVQVDVTVNTAVVQATDDMLVERAQEILKSRQLLIDAYPGGSPDG